MHMSEGYQDAVCFSAMVSPPIRPCFSATVSPPILPLQENLRPTHVLLNFGLWFHGIEPKCGQQEGEARCPYWPKVCQWLNGEHPFKVIWQTTTPKQDIGNTLIEHHLHIPHVCSLDPRSVLHRGQVLYALEPDDSARDRFYHDRLHFAPEAYHAFNGLLLEMVSGAGRASMRVP